MKRSHLVFFCCAAPGLSRSNLPMNVDGVQWSDLKSKMHFEKNFLSQPNSFPNRYWVLC